MTQQFTKFYAGIASLPLYKAKDGTYTFITRSDTDPETDRVPLYSNHGYEEGLRGYADLQYIRLRKTREGRHLCVVLAAIHTDADLVEGQGLSVSFATQYKKANVLFADSVMELSVVDVASTPHCEIVKTSEITNILEKIYNDKHAVRDFADLLDEIGESNVSTRRIDQMIERMAKEATNV